MSALVITRCPHCPAEIDLPPGSATATCPRCSHEFTPSTSQRLPAPAWFSGWGLSALGIATLALLLASLLPARWPTISLAVLGLAIGVPAVVFTAQRGRGAARWCLPVGGTVLAAAVLAVTVFAPWVLNSDWTLRAPVPASDPNQRTAVPRDQPEAAGQHLSDDNLVDAASEGVRQDDLFVRIDSVKAGRLPERGATSYLLANLYLEQRQPGREARFERYVPGKTEPSLTDESGRRYTFVADRVRREPTKFDLLLKVDHLLVFELPPSGVTPLTLELPAAAWGRQGVCRFRIATVDYQPTPDMAREVARYKKMLRMPPREPPDPARGRALFVKTCQECHTLHGLGAKIGPDLTKSKRDDLDFLITSIVDPSAVIEKEFQTTLVEMTTGVVYNGIVKNANAEAVTLLIPNRLVTIPRGMIDSMRDSKVSLMPNGLLKEFSEHDVRSLIAYLSGRSQGPLLATAENAPHYFSNRQDLGTWHSSGAPWRLEDDALSAPGPRNDRPAVLVSDLVLASDFHMTLRFHPGTDGHGAVQLRDAGRPEEATGPRVEFVAGAPLALVAIEGRRAEGDGEAAPDVTTGAWNKLEIVRADDRLEIRLNDKVAVVTTETRLGARRVIALEGPRTGNVEVRFRNLDMRVPAEKN